jgi:hypothetical protein
MVTTAENLVNTNRKLYFSQRNSLGRATSARRRVCYNPPQPNLLTHMNVPALGVTLATA